MSGFVRPKVCAPLKLLDWVLEMVSAAILAGLLLFVAASWQRLPKTIPVHFNALGAIDRYGDKSALLVIIPVVLLLFGFITLLTRYPWLYNYPVAIDENNCIRQYMMAARLLRFIKLEIVALFAYMESVTVLAASSGKMALGSWFIPGNLTVLTGTLLIYLLLAKKCG